MREAGEIIAELRADNGAYIDYIKSLKTELAEARKSADIAIDERIACGKALEAAHQEIAELRSRLFMELDRSDMQDAEPVAWRWSENGGARWFDWTTDWTHHERAKSMGCLIEYANPAPNAENNRDAERYRLLRNAVCTDDETAMVDIFDGSFVGEFPTQDEFDAAIDAAMQGKDE